MRAFPPATEIYAFLYAQVYQSDQQDFRNVLLSHKPARFRQKPLEGRTVADAGFGDATWSQDEILFMLAGLTLGPDTPLSCLAVETLPGGTSVADPMGRGLGQERLLRSSPLVPVPGIC